MRTFAHWTVTALFGALATTAVAAEKIAAKDYCDPTDPAWNALGGCLLREGDVTLAEFNALVTSVLSSAVVGHPAWSFEPTFTELKTGEVLHLRNEGGRTHTFTEVAAFGGGIVPPLNVGLTPAPECTVPGGPPNTIAPGERLTLRNLDEGDHLFQCCFHPWMRALVKVED